MKYSIIIPTYNKYKETLEKCLYSLLTYTDLKEVEIIIVANGCTDETITEVKKLQQYFKNIHLLIFESPLGYTKAGNEGLKFASGDYIVLLNNDVVILPSAPSEWLHIMNEPFQNDKKVGITGPMKEYSPQADRYFVLFFCAMFSREVFERIGLMDEIFSPGYGEDTDYCCRIEDIGYKVVQVPDESNNYYEDKRKTGKFPLYHEGNVTFKNWPGGEELLKRNNQTLFDRYNKNSKKVISELDVLKPLLFEPTKQPLMIDISRALKCDGYMTDAELAWLATNAIGKKTIIEVGSWHGKSTRALGDHVDGVVYAVDTWNGSAGEEMNHGSARWRDGDHAFYEFLQNNIDLIQRGKMIPLRMTSKNAAEFIKEAGIKADLIFIDAGHTYEECKQDIDMWKDSLNPHGILCGHDYSHSWPGVPQAVNESFQYFSVGENTTIWNTDNVTSKPQREPKVFDCFPFFNETEVLEIRLDELWDVVDRFVIVEAKQTHSGKPKGLNFDPARFQKYLSKITYMVVEQLPNDGDSWTRERFQRDYVMNGLKECQDNDIIIISDLDEIPNPDAIKLYMSMTPDGSNTLYEFVQKLYYYNETNMCTVEWQWAKILRYGLLKQMSPCGARYEHNCPKLGNGGWHFSYFGNVDSIKSKIEATAHVEYDLPDYKNETNIQKSLLTGKDIYNRPIEFKKVPIDSSFPKLIRKKHNV